MKTSSTTENVLTESALTEGALTEGVDEKIVILSVGQDGQLRGSDVKMFELLFQHLPDVYFYAKDVDGCWISCNASSLALLNYSKLSDVVGKRESDFFPQQIALEILRDDENILTKGKSVLGRIEIIPNAFGELIWVQTNKLPIYDVAGKVIGIIGVTRPISNMEDLPQRFELFSETIAFIRANLAVTIKVTELAALVKLSENQFRRRFKSDFGVTPQQFILRARLQSAGHLLRSSAQPIAGLAADSGFSDQSYFTKQFKQFFGETPLQYRRRWASG